MPLPQRPEGPTPREPEPQGLPAAPVPSRSHGLRSPLRSRAATGRAAEAARQRQLARASAAAAWAHPSRPAIAWEVVQSDAQTDAQVDAHVDSQAHSQPQSKAAAPAHARTPAAPPPAPLLPRLQFALAALILAFARPSAAAAQGAPEAPAAPRPNVLLIVVDDLGFGDLGCFGRESARTPRIDGLAQQGTRFAQFYAGGPECSPSRAALLTGRFPAEIAIHRAFVDPAANQARGMPNWLDPQLPTLARGLAARGYSCRMFGKWHLGSQEAPGLPGPEAYGFERALTSAEMASANAGRAERSSASQRLVDAVLEDLRGDPEGPWFLWVALPDMHHPLLPSEEQLAPFRRFDPRQVPWPGPEEIFLAALAEMDRQVGRLLDGLEALGQSADTLVLLTSDNGPENPDTPLASHAAAGSTGPLRGRKTSLYEGGIRMPLIARWPGRVPAGRVDERSLLSAIDLLPTLLALAGAPPSPAERGAGRGEDISPALFAQPFERQGPLLWEWRLATRGHPTDASPRLALRRGPWKLLANPSGNRLELFDILQDPSELENRAALEPERAQKLLTELRRWHATLPPGTAAPEAGKRPKPWPRESSPPAQGG